MNRKGHHDISTHLNYHCKISTFLQDTFSMSFCLNYLFFKIWLAKSQKHKITPHKHKHSHVCLSRIFSSCFSYSVSSSLSLVFQQGSLKYSKQEHSPFDNMIWPRTMFNFGFLSKMILHLTLLAYTTTTHNVHPTILCNELPGNPPHLWYTREYFLWIRLTPRVSSLWEQRLTE